MKNWGEKEYWKELIRVYLLARQCGCSGKEVKVGGSKKKKKIKKIQGCK